MTQQRCILWFRQDLRLQDNPALHYTVRNAAVLPIYILDDHHADVWKMGAASRWWLHHSLQSLKRSLDNQLAVFSGDPLTIIPQLVEQYRIDSVVWNRCYEPWQIARDKRLKTQLIAQGVDAKSFNGALLWEPWEVLKKDGTPYKVFTPYYRNGCLPLPPAPPEAEPETIAFIDHESDTSDIDSLQLIPTLPWHKAIARHWHPGESGAIKALKTFSAESVEDYAALRDFPAQSGVSRLSPHLHFGELSPRQVWHIAADATAHKTEGLACFQRELAWREFSYYLLYHFPSLPESNFQEKFDHFQWDNNLSALTAWQQGMTGIPIVDAGMRELWQTGYMHNRVRMIVGSFLTKNLLLHWSHGVQWFWDCLLDADLANNSAGWQWIAGSGADAAPYFRIFNPVTQGEKFDPEGHYVRRYCPELARLPNQHLHKPWQAKPAVLQEAGIVLGNHYPKPIVDLKTSRQRALDTFAVLKNKERDFDRKSSVDS